jgi:hypothetical protein
MSTTDQDFAARRRFLELNQLSLALPLGDVTCEILGWGFLGERWWRNYLHVHSFYEVCCAFDGEGVFRINGEEHVVRAGDLFVARPTEPHEIVSSEDAPLGISWAIGAIAETGTVLVSSRDGRRTQLLPPSHLVFIPQEKIYGTLLEAMNALKSDLPAAIGLHSGPSKSADIGQIMVKGVHGPGRLVAAVVEEPKD